MRKERETAPRRQSGYEETVLTSLRRIIRAVDLYSRRLMSRHGLSGPQLLCLTRLAKGPMLSGALARELSLSPATVTGILDRLESRDLVERKRQIDDKRTVVVSLTSTGKALLDQAPPPLQQGFVTRLRALPEREQAQIAATLERIVAMMAAEDIDAAPMLAAGDAVASVADAGTSLMDDI